MKCTTCIYFQKPKQITTKEASPRILFIGECWYDLPNYVKTERGMKMKGAQRMTHSERYCGHYKPHSNGEKPMNEKIDDSNRNRVRASEIQRAKKVGDFVSDDDKNWLYNYTRGK